eukprot:15340047-Ditylum_brightwellii.AAC.1
MVTTTLSLKQPCMLCQAKFKHSDMEQVKLTQCSNDNSTTTKKCPILLESRALKASFMWGVVQECGLSAAVFNRIIIV